MKPTIVITDWGFPSLEPERRVFAPFDVELNEYQCKTEAEVAAVVKDADVVLTQWAPVKAQAIAAMERCKGIVRYGTGLDNVDLTAARQKGIPVKNVPDYCLDEVADHTMALILALQRQVHSVDQQVRRGIWKITPPLPLPPLRNSSLGLIGFGRIAQLVAKRMEVFGMRILASDPVTEEMTFKKLRVQRAPTQEVFSSADIVSLHCPLTEETRHIVNTSSLESMKNHALLVNTSRGGLVDTRALVQSLERRQLVGAALDVVEDEPLPVDHPLLTMENVIITSHIAWYSSASGNTLQEKAARTAVELLGFQ